MQTLGGGVFFFKLNAKSSVKTNGKKIEKNKKCNSIRQRKFQHNTVTII